MRAVSVELLYFEECPNHEPLELRLRDLLRRGQPGTMLQLRRVESETDAERLRFLGSPTVRVNGRDIEAHADERDDYGLKCRLYRVGDALVGQPPDAWISDALDTATRGSSG